MTSCYISLALALTLIAKSRLSSSRIFWKNKVEAPTSLRWLPKPTGGPRLVRHLCQKLLKNRTIVNLGQAHTSISANFPQNTALFEVLVEPYKNRTISRIALIKVSLYYLFYGRVDFYRIYTLDISNFDKNIFQSWSIIKSHNCLSPILFRIVITVDF